MTDLVLMPSVAPRHHHPASKRRADCTSPVRFAVVRWSDIACAWLLMMAGTAALLG